MRTEHFGKEGTCNPLLPSSQSLEDPTPPPDRSRRREIITALVLLFGGTFALAGLVLVLPVLSGSLQAILALMLFGIPYLVLRGSGQTVDDMGVDLGPWGRTLKVSGLAMLIVFPPFVLGFHLVQTTLAGQAPMWDAERLLRWDERLEDTPRAPCPGDGVSTDAWIDRTGLWILAPREERLTVTIERGPRGVEGRAVRCKGVAMPTTTFVVREMGEGHYRLPRGYGLWLPLEDTHELALNISSGKTPAKLRLGAHREAGEAPGRLEGTRDWWWIPTFIIVHLGLVALPEEWFFRGYLQTRLDERYGTPWTLLGVKVGWGFILASVAFALLHPILIPGVHRLAVFFPGLLFGWLRAKTGNIGAAVVFHAASNLIMALVSRMYV